MPVRQTDQGDRTQEGVERSIKPQKIKNSSLALQIMAFAANLNLMKMRETHRRVLLN